MSRPKLTVTEVFIVSDVIPYEGSDVIAVHATLEGAKKDREGPWTETTAGVWSNHGRRDDYKGFLIIERQEIRP
jgi:hypothetical protein